MSDTAYVCLVVDRSGSMQSTRQDAQGGLDSFVDAFKSNPDVVIELIEFDDRIDVAVPAVAASAWPGYTLTPRGSTALLDAVAHGVTRTGDYIDKHAPAKSVLCVITDGGENASREFSKEKVTELIDGIKARGTEMVFLASDLSAISTGASVGFSSTTTYRPSGASTRAAHSSLLTSVSAYFDGTLSSVVMPDSIDEPEEAAHTAP